MARTLFQIGDTIKDDMFPSSERLTVTGFDRSYLGLHYLFVTNRGETKHGLQSIIEKPGRFSKINVTESTK